MSSPAPRPVWKDVLAGAAWFAAAYGLALAIFHFGLTRGWYRDTASTVATLVYTLAGAGALIKGAYDGRFIRFLFGILLFGAAWAGISAAHRAYLAAMPSKMVISDATGTAVRAERNLTLSSYNRLAQRLLVVGSIDTLVVADERAGRSISYRLARGAQCQGATAGPIWDQVTPGAQDACIVSYAQTGTAEGVHLTARNEAMLAGNDGLMRTLCCETLAITLRKDGKDSELARLRIGKARVLSWLPLGFGESSNRGALWTSGWRTIDLVFFGDDPGFDHTREGVMRLLSNLYGVDVTGPVASARLLKNGMAP